jgi:hypothetical protein
MLLQRPWSFTGRSVPLSRGAFTRLDLLAILVALALLTSVVLPALAGVRSRSTMVECLNNLRRVGRGFQGWANEHGDRYPWSVPQTEGGSLAGASACDHFRTVSNELGSPVILVCPSDTNRTVTSQWDFFTDNRFLSYSAGLHGSLSQPRAWLSGDRNITGTEGQACTLSGVQTCTGFSQGSTSTWLSNLHAYAGNLLLGDGSVRQVSQRDLERAVDQAVAQDPERTFHVLKP